MSAPDGSEGRRGEAPGGAASGGETQRGTPGHEARGSDAQDGKARKRGAPGHGAQGSEALPGLLLESLQALAEAGQVEPACRLAGRAYMALRHDAPAEARRFDVFLHRMSRRLDW